MRRIGQLFGFFLIVGFALTCLSAENPAALGNPYTAIIDRNIFSLVDMPTNPPADTKPAEPPLKITPNGIMTIFGQLQVIFKVATPTKPGVPAQDHSYVLSVGERQDDIEVTKIDESSRTITFNNHGIIQELSLTNATIASTPATPIALPPGMGLRPGFSGAPNGIPAARFAGGHNFGNSAGMNPNGSNPNTSAMPNFGGNNIGANNSQSAEQLSPEAQVIAIEAQRAQWQQENNPAHSPLLLPPTAITKQLQGGDEPPAPGVP